jgi:hypothetical protein
MITADIISPSPFHKNGITVVFYKYCEPGGTIFDNLASHKSDQNERVDKIAGGIGQWNWL